jgi:hypothetical protein
MDATTIQATFKVEDWKRFHKLSLSSEQQARIVVRPTLAQARDPLAELTPADEGVLQMLLSQTRYARQIQIPHWTLCRANAEPSCLESTRPSNAEILADPQFLTWLPA